MLLRRTITTSELRSIVSAMGYLPDGRRTLATYSFTIFFILYSINLTCGLSHQWSNFKVRLEIIRNLVLLCNIQEILNEINGMEDDSQHFVRTFVVVSFCYTRLPVLNAVYARLTMSSASDFRDLPQVSYLHYPLNKGRPVTLGHYLCGALFLYAGNLSAALFSFCFLYASYLALRCVTDAFQQLAALIQHWNNSAANTTQPQVAGLREIVAFHQQICREARLLNKGIETATLNLLQGCVVQLCLGLFSILEGGDKIKYGGFTCFVLLMLVGFSSFGQILEDRIGRVRTSIWESDWVSRPHFIRKALFTMMIGATARLELRPYGLQQLNMRSFASVLKTVYSLFNVVNQSR
ncbi:hypothetical protein LSTR_LSTR012182 [Laodelphax striatellus]|uniref:Odorant receptor n=1 Tax=Laodelphax striatellus TaxID=195883 RepID=A0A482WMV7_LAOST|nr:hypothetical protein LSTR_LSTR012182 [Laodelphax striatellus]